jgi:hypothetical protein
MKFFVIAFLTGWTCCVSAQTVLLDQPLGKATAPKFQGVVSGDSVFVSLFQTGKSSGYWISANGVREFNLPELTGKSLFAVGRADSSYYYFLIEEKKKLYIGALVVKDESRTIAKAKVPLNARLYGAYVENGHLFLLMAEESGYRLKLAEFAGLKMVRNQSFALSFDLGRLKNQSVSFYQSGTSTMPSDVIAPIKIVKDKEAIWITIDEPKPPYQAQPLDLFRTTVLKLGLKNGETRARMFPTRSEDFFNSVVLDGFLYRLIQEANYYVEVFKIESGEKIGTYSEPELKDAQQEFPVTVRDGVRSIVLKQTRKKFGLSRGSKAFVLVDSISTGGVLATLGVHVENSPKIPVVGNLAALFFVMNEVVLKSVEGAITYVYTHFFIRDNKLDLFDEPATRRQRIDTYELGFGASKKAFFHTRSHSYGVYLISNFTQFRVVRFD